jgi:hypothetical protein
MLLIAPQSCHKRGVDLRPQALRPYAIVATPFRHPRIRRGEKAHLTFIQSIHDSFLVRQSGIVFMEERTACVEFRIPHSAFRI